MKAIDIIALIGALAWFYKMYNHKKYSTYDKLTFIQNLRIGRYTLNPKNVKYFLPMKLEPNKPYIPKNIRIRCNIALCIGYLCLITIIIIGVVIFF